MNRMMSGMAAAVLLSILVGNPAGAQVAGLGEDDNRCYRLILGEWDPALVPANASRQTPPDVFLLSPDVHEGEARVAHPIIPFGTWPSARWRVGEGDTITVRWTNGFSGVQLRMQASGDTLVGTAGAFTDVIRTGRPSPRASATAYPVPCPGWLVSLAACPRL